MGILDTTTKNGFQLNGALPKQSNVLSGYSLPNQTQTQNSGIMSGGQSVQTPISGGTNPGMINKPKPDTTYTATTTTNGKGGTSSKPTPNKSVLAQQQSLNQTNKNTPGYVALVEDGLAGPKTQAAVEKYGFNTQTGQPNTPKTSTTSGVLPKTETPKDTNAPVGNTVSGQIGNVANTGNQTQNEIETQARLMELSQKGSPEYQAAQTAYQQAIQDYNASVQNQAGAMAGEASRAIPLGFVQGRQQVLQSQYGAQQAGLGGLVSGASNALGAANTQQGLLNTAAGAAYSGAQTQAGRGTTAATSVLGAVKPQFPGYNTPVYNPGQGAFQGSGGTTGNPQTDIQNYVSQLSSGTSGMGYDQAMQQLTSAYGGVVANQLLPAILKQNPNFNVNQSNAVASAQVSNIGKSGQIGAFADKAVQGLTSLQEAYDKLPAPFKTGGNLIGDAMSGLAETTGIGKTQVDNFNRILSEVRASVQAVLSTAVELGVVRGGTTVDALLPRNMSPEGLKTATATINTLMTQTKDALSKASNANVGTSGSTTGGGYAEVW